MILTTEQQANNVAIYAMEVDPIWAILEDLNREALVGRLMTQVASIMGQHTFEEKTLERIVRVAIDHYYGPEEAA